jgi:hypothetical protein
MCADIGVDRIAETVTRLVHRFGNFCVPDSPPSRGLTLGRYGGHPSLSGVSSLECGLRQNGERRMACHP